MLFVNEFSELLSAFFFTNLVQLYITQTVNGELPG